MRQSHLPESCLGSKPACASRPLSSIALQTSSPHWDVVVGNDLRRDDHRPPGIVTRCPRRSPTGTASQVGHRLTATANFLQPHCRQHVDLQIPPSPHPKRCRNASA